MSMVRDRRAQACAQLAAGGRGGYLNDIPAAGRYGRGARHVIPPGKARQSMHPLRRPALMTALLLLVGPLAANAPTQGDAPSRVRPTRPPTGLKVDWKASGRQGVVAAGGAESVEAGLTLLRTGGNAADAAAATLLALTVTDAQLFCFGGEVPILVYDAKRNVVEVICGQGAAPKLATRAYFAAKGGIPAGGIEPAAVPGALDAIVVLLDRYGTKTFAEAVAPALAVLDRGGQRWHADLARTLRRLIEAERSANGDRTRGLRLVSDAFYRGPVAREIDAWSRQNGGLLRYSDLATHTSRVEDAVSLNYRGHAVYKCGPWTQGPALLQSLQLLEGFDFKGHSPTSPDAIHLAAEAMKLGLADRDFYYADPLFADVPLAALFSSDYAAARRALIDSQRASLEYRPGDPRAGKAVLADAEIQAGVRGPAHDTTTCLVADARGNVIAATPSGWSGVLAGDTGVWLGTRLQSFNTWEGHVNCIEPGKRPRITLTPTLVLKEGKPVMAVSVAGGDVQDQVTLQLLMNMIDFGLSPAEAVTAARFNTNHHLGSFRQTPPELGSLIVDPTVPEKALEVLRERGHKIKVEKRIGDPIALRIDPVTGVVEAAGDPKAGRHAGAVDGSAAPAGSR